MCVCGVVQTRVGTYLLGNDVEIVVVSTKGAGGVEGTSVVYSWVNDRKWTLLYGECSSWLRVIIYATSRRVCASNTRHMTPNIWMTSGK